MVVRLLFLLAVALVVGAPGMDTSPDAVAAVEHDVGEAIGDADEAQVVIEEVVHDEHDGTAPRAVPETGAPVPPFRHGVFRPPRAAFA